MKTGKVMVCMYLGSSWVGNSFGVNPVIWLGIVGIVDLLGWVDRWIEVFEQATSGRLFVVDRERVSVVGAGCGCQGIL